MVPNCWFLPPGNWLEDGRIFSLERIALLHPRFMSHCLIFHLRPNFKSRILIELKIKSTLISHYLTHWGKYNFLFFILHFRTTFNFSMKIKKKKKKKKKFKNSKICFVAILMFCPSVQPHKKENEVMKNEIKVISWLKFLIGRNGNQFSHDLLTTLLLFIVYCTNNE